MSLTTGRQTTNIRKAARMAALLELYDSGRLATYTYQELGDIFGVNRSTILRDVRLLPRVSQERVRLIYLLGL